MSHTNKSMRRFRIINIIFLLTILHCHGRDNGLALTPPMGWLSWERFLCNTDCEHQPADCIGERLILEHADRLAKDGWAELGYKYITIDDCWPDKARLPNGKLRADTARFPRGMKYVVDYVHSRGLKFGIYADFGTKTCAGYPGSQFYMQEDIATFVEWGVDYIKLDQCNSARDQQVEGHDVFGMYLNRTGRPIVLSCEWPLFHMKDKTFPVKTLQRQCNLWRYFDDIEDSWQSVLRTIDFHKSNPHNIWSWSGPGHFNDPDQLVIGNFGLSPDQERVQMAFWAMMPAPLIMSTDLRKIRNSSRELLMNPRLIALNQDPAGKGATLLKELGMVQVWRRELSNPRVVAVLFLYKSASGGPTDCRITAKMLFSNSTGMLPSHGSDFIVVDLFTGVRVARLTDWNQEYRAVVNPSGAAIFTFTMNKKQ